MFKKLNIWIGIVAGLLVIAGSTWGGFKAIDKRYAKAPDLAAMKRLLDTQSLYFEQKFFIEKKKDLEFWILRLETKRQKYGLTVEEQEILMQKKSDLEDVLREIDSIQDRMDDLRKKDG